MSIIDHASLVLEQASTDLDRRWTDRRWAVFLSRHGRTALFGADLRVGRDFRGRAEQNLSAARRSLHEGQAPPAHA